MPALGACFTGHRHCTNLQINTADLCLAHQLPDIASLTTSKRIGNEWNIDIGHSSAIRPNRISPHFSDQSARQALPGLLS